MRLRSLPITLSLLLAPYGSLLAQGTPAATVGWYNGDWDPSAGLSLANWYVSSTQIARVYDDFIVPDSGWTVVGVFSNNSLSSGAPQVTQASWEIRVDMQTGFGGGVVASGIGPTTPVASSNTYKIEVDGLQVQLPAGHYWLSVTPVTVDTGAYLRGTSGANAVGNPPGNNAGSFVYNTFTNEYFLAPETIAANEPKDCSQGLLIAGPPLSKADQWRADVTSLVQQMESLHTVPFPPPGIDMADFNANATALYTNIPNLSDAQIRTGIEALVSSIEDPHTDVGWGSPSPFSFLPLTFYWFDDGMYITAAPAVYQSLLGGQVVSVGQAAIGDVTNLLTTLVPHTNDWWPKYEIPLNRLPNTDFLFGTGITPDTSGARIVVQTPSGDSASAFVSAPTLNQGTMLQAYQGDLPLYRQHPDQHYWATIIDGGATVYFQYNSCTEDPLQPSAQFIPQLNALLAQDGVQRLIVDMRNNTGGSTSILDPWLQSIRTSSFNSPGRLYVIVGRATFSAAEATSDEFRDETSAIFVGEPTGGKPQFQIRISAFNLPYFGITASYSQGTWQTSDPGPTLVPDIQTGLTFAQYMAGDDPAMDAILAIPAPGAN